MTARLIDTHTDEVSDKQTDTDRQEAELREGE